MATTRRFSEQKRRPQKTWFKSTTRDASKTLPMLRGYTKETAAESTRSLALCAPGSLELTPRGKDEFRVEARCVENYQDCSEGCSGVVSCGSRRCRAIHPIVTRGKATPPRKKSETFHSLRHRKKCSAAKRERKREIHT